MKLIVACVFFLTWNLGIAAYAQQETSPFSFSGGACASQGPWTQSAIAATQEIIRYINQIKDDKNCTGLKAELVKIGAAEEEALAEARDGSGTQLDRLSQIPNELNALAAAQGLSPDEAKNVLRLTMNRNLEQAALTAEMGKTGISLGLPLGERRARVAKRGMELVEVVLDKLPELDRCLVGSQQSVGMMLGGAVKLASAFASSGDSSTSRLSNTMVKLASTLRDRKYTQILRRLDQAQFWTSMSCLIETTSEMWCSVRDAQTTFNKGLRDMGITQTVGKDGKPLVKANHPFEGYYLLVQQVPIITRWMQKIQIGVDPRLETDASFQASILDTINDHIKRVKKVQGIYSRGLETMRGYSDKKAQRQAVMDMLVSIAGSLGAGTGGDLEEMGGIGDSKIINFFTITKPGPVIPFYLIGQGDVVPPRVSARDQLAAPITWVSWMLNNGTYIAEFNDPEARALVIGDKLKLLIDEANIRALEYFSKWFVVDKPTLVNESIAEIRYNVIESLEHIYQYLERLKGRVNTYHGDPAVIPAIIETQKRIEIVLKSYESIRALAKADSSDTLTYLKKEAEVYQSVIDTVYQQFNVMLQRAGYISNRMTTFVYYDYSLMVRSNADLNQYEKEIYTAAGRGIIERMIQLYNGNPANVLTDLQTAAKLNKTSLEAVESLVRDSLYPVMVEFNEIAKGNKPTDMSLAMLSVARLFRDSYVPRKYPGKDKWDKETIFQKEHPVRGFLHRYVPPYALMFTPWVQNWFQPDLYPMYIGPYQHKRGADDEFHNARQILARLCVQTLGFENWIFYSPVCEGAVLQSPFDGTGSPDFNLNIAYNKKAYDAQPAKICAFRDFGRRNMIFWLTHLMQEQNQ